MFYQSDIKVLDEQGRVLEWLVRNLNKRSC
jgi:hypothetical protein